MQSDIVRMTEERAKVHTAAIAAVLTEDMLWALDMFESVGRVQVPDDHASRIKDALSALVGDTGRAVGEMVLGGLTKADDFLWDRIVDEYMETFGGIKVTRISATTLATLQDLLIGSEEESLPEIAAKIRLGIPEMSKIRAAIIARTETHSASQFSSQKVAETIKVPLMKVWNSTEDHRTRDFGEIGGTEDYNHRAMNGVKVALDQPFRVPSKWGGHEFLMFPGDPNGSAANVINCRCVQTYERAV